MAQQINSGMHQFLAQDRVIWGKPAARALIEEADRRKARRLFIVTSKTLNRKTDAVESLRRALGPRCVGTFDECREHTPRASVFAAAQAVRAADPDLIVTFGGGTAIDTVKVLLIVLAEGLTDPRQLDDYYIRANPDGSRHIPAVKPPPLRQVVISTTLSAAEFSDAGGCSDPERGAKDAYSGREIGAAAVILDPAVTLHTPEWLWLSTGIRALDHAVEGLCSIETSPLVEATALQALRLLPGSLEATKRNPADLAARLASLQGAWMSGFGIFRVPFGASHGIGHSLGAVTGMSHGYTSCVMLPHVMRFNRPYCEDKLARIANTLGAADGNAAGAVAGLIARLGLPTRLRDVGVRKDQFDQIARGAMGNIFVRTNPRPIRDQADVMALLEAAW
ncbi:MAG: iron-containing alcohol dehydrogenase [Pseudomonadota bacterium]